MAVALPRFMMLLRVTVCSTILLVLCSSASPVDDVQKTAEEMLNRARQLSDIRSPNAPGFRLNVTFSFAGPDLDTLHGTYTEVWKSNSQWRRETVVGDFRRIEIGGPDRYWLIDGGKDLPEEAARVATVVDMFPKRSATIEFETITDLGPTTQCAVTKAEGERHLKHAFCFDKDKHLLKENVAPQEFFTRAVDYSCHYNRFRKFGDYWFPQEVVCFMDRRQRLEARVVDLSPEPSPETALFTPPAGAVGIGDCSVTPVPPEAVSTPLSLIHIYRQRAQQDALHQGEDGGVSADAESERDDRCDGEPRRLAQLAQGVAHVLKKGFHGILHAHAHTL